MFYADYVDDSESYNLLSYADVNLLEIRGESLTFTGFIEYLSAGIIFQGGRRSIRERVNGGSKSRDAASVCKSACVMMAAGTPSA